MMKRIESFFINQPVFLKLHYKCSKRNDVKFGSTFLNFKLRLLDSNETGMKKKFMLHKRLILDQSP